MKNILLVLLLLLPTAQGLFVDVLPLQPTGVTTVTEAQDHWIAGHANGRILAVDPDTLQNAWSARPEARRPLEAASTGPLAVIGYDSGGLYALDATTGSTSWSARLPAAITGMSASAQRVVVATETGIVRAFAASDGTQTLDVDLGTALLGLAADADTIVATGRDASWVLDGTGQTVATVERGGRDAQLSQDALVLVGTDGTLAKIARSDWSLLATYDPTYDLTAVGLASNGRIVAGDDQSLLHVLEPSLSLAFPPLATYAARVEDVHITASNQILAAFQSGWLGHLPMRAAPVVLITEPQELRFLPGTAEVTFAYAQPIQTADDIVFYQVEVRPKGSTSWQTAASGIVQVSPLTRFHTVNIDLSVFPSGSALDMQVTVRDDKRGEVGRDRFVHSLLVDHTPPYRPAPEEIRIPVGEGEQTVDRTRPIPHRQPSILVGHRDDHSSIRPGFTTAMIDGSSADVFVEPFIAFTRITPLEPLDDGRHTWSVSVKDGALNPLTLHGSFVIDVSAPTISAFQADALAPHVAAVSLQTDEPATCEVRAGNQRWVLSKDASSHHAGTLDGLAGGTRYELGAFCTDTAGRTGSSSLTIDTPALPPGAPQPILDVQVSPSGPDGARDWYTTIPSIAASTDIPATIWWSLDGNAFTRSTPSLEAGGHAIRAFAISDEGVSSAPFSLDVHIDTTPPLLQNVVSLDPLRAIRWDEATDAESGMHGFIIEGRTSDQEPWVELGRPGATTVRFEAIPLDVSQVRVHAENTAGLRTTSPPVSFVRDDERIHTVASVQQRTVHIDDYVTVQFLLAHEDLYRTALLSDTIGVEHEFSDVIKTGERRFEASAPASAFGTGGFQAYLRFLDGGTELTTLAAGPVDIVQETKVVDPDGQEGADQGGQVDRESPAVAWLALALTVAVLARRRL